MYMKRIFQSIVGDNIIIHTLFLLISASNEIFIRYSYMLMPGTEKNPAYRLLEWQATMFKDIFPREIESRFQLSLGGLIKQWQADIGLLNLIKA